MLRAGIYARYSSDMQDAASIDAQVRACEDYAKREGIEIVEIYTDEALSAKNDNRKDFMRMINDAKARKFDIVLVHKFNRFARNKYDSAVYKKGLRDIGIRVVSATQYIDDTPEGKLLEGFLEAIDEYYSDNLALEVKKGMKEKALKAIHVGGRPPLGFSLNEDKKLVPNDKAIIVQKIFQMYADGYGKRTIANTLNELGYRSQTGNKISDRTILDIIRNKKYIGTYTVDLAEEVIEVPNAHTPIISEALWNKVQEVNKQRGAKPRMTEENQLYHLTGKIRCGVCGEVFTGCGFKRGSDKRSKIYYYTCVGKRKKHHCSNGALNKEKSEHKIVNHIFDRILSDEEIKRIASFAEEQARLEYQAPEESVDDLKKKRKALETKRSKLLDLYLEDKFDKDTLDKKSDDLTHQIIALDKRIKIASVSMQESTISAEEVQNALKKIKYGFDENNKYMVKALIDTFVDKIIVNRDSLDIHYKIDFNNITTGVNFDLEGEVKWDVEEDVDSSDSTGYRVRKRRSLPPLSPTETAKKLRYPVTPMEFKIEIAK